MDSSGISSWASWRIQDLFWKPLVGRVGNSRKDSRDPERHIQRGTGASRNGTEKTKQERLEPSPSPTSFRVKPPRPEKASRGAGAEERLGRAAPPGLHRVTRCRLAAAVPGQVLQAPVQESPSSRKHPCHRRC